eukprot:18486-Heterocapsa_arctica.AAC.1
MVTARARPDSPVSPKQIMLYVVRDMLDGSLSTFSCASDGASSSSGSGSSSSGGSSSRSSSSSSNS